MRRGILCILLVIACGMPAFAEGKDEGGVAMDKITYSTYWGYQHPEAVAAFEDLFKKDTGVTLEVISVAKDRWQDKIAGHVRVRGCRGLHAAGGRHPSIPVEAGVPGAPRCLHRQAPRLQAAQEGKAAGLPRRPVHGEDHRDGGLRGRVDELLGPAGLAGQARPEDAEIHGRDRRRARGVQEQCVQARSRGQGNHTDDGLQFRLAARRALARLGLLQRGDEEGRQVPGLQPDPRFQGVPGLDEGSLRAGTARQGDADHRVRRRAEQERDRRGRIVRHVGGHRRCLHEGHAGQQDRRPHGSRAAVQDQEGGVRPFLRPPHGRLRHQRQDAESRSSCSTRSSTGSSCRTTGSSPRAAGSRVSTSRWSTAS